LTVTNRPRVGGNAGNDEETVMNDDTDTHGTEPDGQTDEAQRGFVRPIPENFEEMSHEEKREYARLLLGLMSPNPEVRRRSNEELTRRGITNIADNPRDTTDRRPDAD
jgi:hypothetical protein